jgi:hypothetical protein
VSGKAREIAGIIAYLGDADGPRLEDERAATDIIGDAVGSGAQMVVIPVARLGPGFLTLSTRIAGGAIQKFVTYDLRVVFVGDIAEAVAARDAVRDFVRESNRGRHVWFVGDLAELEAKIANLARESPHTLSGLRRTE